MSTIKLCFLYVLDGEEGCFYFLEMPKKTKKIAARLQFLCLFTRPFCQKRKKKENLKEIQDLSINEFLLMYSLTSFVCAIYFPRRIFAATPLTDWVSSGLAALLYAHLALTKVLIQAAQHGRKNSSVCMCRCLLNGHSVCVRVREAKVFSHTLGWFIHPSARWALLHANTHLGAVSCISHSTAEQCGN